MVFSAPIFLFAFLPLVLLAYRLAPASWRHPLLLAASLLFYLWGGGAFIILLLISTLVDFAAGRWVASGLARGHRSVVRAGVGLSVTVNLGLLAYFKYANFFVQELNRLASHWGFGDIAWTSVALPIGISFYTFQSMSYTLDLAQGRAKPIASLVDFALYVTLFPQLIAGPIVRFHELADQLRDHPQTVSSFARGVVRFSHGLAKKVIVADAAGAVADAAFALPSQDLSAASAWLGVIAYAVQIYFDFSGYSDMAIGLAAMFGFELPENFRRPYSAFSITDHWRRWHMSLSRWFRDYLYIPLGGSRGGTLKTAVNLWLVFGLVGLWHGAAWTFLLWGVYHGCLLSIERLSGQRPVEGEKPSFQIARRILVAFLVLVGWVLFRSQDLEQVRAFYAAMIHLGDWTLAPDLREALTHRHVILIFLGFATLLLPGHFVTGPWLLGDRPPARVARWLLLLVALPYALILAISGSFSPFLYFQF